MIGSGVPFKSGWVAGGRGGVLFGFIFNVGLDEGSPSGGAPSVGAALRPTGAPDPIPVGRSVLRFWGSRCLGVGEGVCCHRSPCSGAASELFAPGDLWICLVAGGSVCVAMLEGGEERERLVRERLLREAVECVGICCFEGGCCW